jgi:hypothetical protein
MAGLQQRAETGQPRKFERRAVKRTVKWGSRSIGRVKTKNRRSKS